MSYVPVDGGPWRLTMGLRPLDPSRWLEGDERRAHELAEKHRLLASVPSRVVAALPGSEPAGADLYDAVVDFLARYHPGAVSHRADGTVEDQATGHVVDPTTIHAVDAAARLVQEDLCVMERRGDAWILTAASVCFPSRWDLAAKLGHSVAEIHGPVPGYANALARPVDAFFERLRTDRPVWRLNWSILDRPDLYQPDPADRRRPAELLADPARQTWFRVERQTLRRLTERPAVTFTIRTYVTSLGDLLAAYPDTRTALRDTLATVPPETAAYKGFKDSLAPLLAWLDTADPAVSAHPETAHPY